MGRKLKYTGILFLLLCVSNIKADKYIGYQRFLIDRTYIEKMVHILVDTILSDTQKEFIYDSTLRVYAGDDFFGDLDFDNIDEYEGSNRKIDINERIFEIE